MYNFLEIALHNFNAMDELFYDLGFRNGCPLSELDFKHAITKLHGSYGSWSSDQKVLTQGLVMQHWPDELVNLYKFGLCMLRLRYLMHFLKPVIDAWRGRACV